MTELFENDFDEAFNTHSFDATHNEHGYEYDNEIGHVQASENMNGGHDFLQDGVYSGHSEENVLGGRDYYDESHHLVAKTMDNGIGGEYVYSNHGFEGTLNHSIEGHDTFYGSGEVIHFDSMESGNASHIMSYDDPLSHIDSYIMPDLLL